MNKVKIAENFYKAVIIFFMLYSHLLFILAMSKTNDLPNRELYTFAVIIWSVPYVIRNFFPRENTLYHILYEANESYKKEYLNGKKSYFVYADDFCAEIQDTSYNILRTKKKTSSI